MVRKWFCSNRHVNSQTGEENDESEDPEAADNTEVDEDPNATPADEDADKGGVFEDLKGKGEGALKDAKDGASTAAAAV